MDKLSCVNVKKCFKEDLLVEFIIVEIGKELLRFIFILKCEKMK